MSLLSNTLRGINWFFADQNTEGSLPAVMGYGTMAAVLLGAFDYTGGRINGWSRDSEADEFERKQYMRKNRRRPIEETIAEVGEGRGTLCYIVWLRPRVLLT